MSPPTIVLLVCIAFATLWSVLRAAQTAERLQIAHLSAISAVAMGVAASHYGAHDETKVIGALLVVAGLLAAWHERSWKRLPPLVLAAAGAGLVFGLPLTG